MGRKKRGCGPPRDRIPLQDAVSDQEFGGDPDPMEPIDIQEETELRHLSQMVRGKRGMSTRGRPEQTVMDISDSDSSDEGEVQYEDDIVGGQGWGKKKKYFYGGNPNERYPGQQDPDEDDDELNEAELEAKESEKLQRKMLQEMDDDDFLDAFVDTNQKKSLKSSDLSKESVSIDLSKLSKKEKLKLFSKESPEFAGIVADLDQKMKEAREKLAPIVEFIDQGKIPAGPAADFVKTRYQIILNYCLNITCYLMFKSKRTPLQFHPITGRLVQYKRLLDEMEEQNSVVMPQIEKILTNLKGGKSIDALVKKAKKKSELEKKKESSKSRKLRILDPSVAADSNPVSEINAQALTTDEMDAIAMYEATRKKKRNNIEEDEDEVEDENEDEVEDETEDKEDERRGITYQIAKNKGLTPKRSKLQRNPRVKHRVKFAKAKVRRKGQVREVRKEVKKYAGEMSGINMRVKKGIKLA